MCVSFECQQQSEEYIRQHYDSWLGEYVYELFNRHL